MKPTINPKDLPHRGKTLKTLIIIEASGMIKDLKDLPNVSNKHIRSLTDPEFGTVRHYVNYAFFENMNNTDLKKYLAKVETKHPLVIFKRKES